MLKIKIAAIAAVVALPMLTLGCGKGNSNDPSINSVPGYATPVGCTPITSDIAFTASGLYYDQSHISGGYSPNNQQSYGQIIIGGGNYSASQYQWNGSNGSSLAMDISPIQDNSQQYGGSYYNSSRANARGILRLSARDQQEILSRTGYNNGGYTNGGYYNGGNTGYNTPGYNSGYNTAYNGYNNGYNTGYNTPGYNTPVYNAPGYNAGGYNTACISSMNLQLTYPSAYSHSGMPPSGSIQVYVNNSQTPVTIGFGSNYYNGGY